MRQLLREHPRAIALVAAILVVAILTITLSRVSRTLGPLQANSSTEIETALTGSLVVTWGVDIPPNTTSEDIVIRSAELIDPKNLVVVGMVMTNVTVTDGVIVTYGPFPPSGMATFPVEGAILSAAPPSGPVSELEVVIGLSLAPGSPSGSVEGVVVRYTAAGREYEIALPYAFTTKPPSEPAQ